MSVAPIKPSPDGQIKPGPGGRSKPGPDGPPPIPVSPHLLTFWFGFMATGGLAFGALADQQPFGKAVLGHPLVVLFAVAAAGLLVLQFLHQRPVHKLIPPALLAAGCVIAAACYFIGAWFETNLAAVP